MTQLMQAVERKRLKLIIKLIERGYVKTTDGRQLYELTLTELVGIDKNLKRRKAE
jgi:hypothetical protein